jgi:hypothetical protein
VNRGCSGAGRLHAVIALHEVCPDRELLWGMSVPRLRRPERWNTGTPSGSTGTVEQRRLTNRISVSRLSERVGLVPEQPSVQSTRIGWLKDIAASEDQRETLQSS